MCVRERGGRGDDLFIIASKINNANLFDSNLPPSSTNKAVWFVTLHIYVNISNMYDLHCTCDAMQLNLRLTVDKPH